MLNCHARVQQLIFACTVDAAAFEVQLALVFCEGISFIVELARTRPRPTLQHS